MPPETGPGFRDVNGVSLRVRRDGTAGPVVVLVHELGGTLESWDEVAADLARDHRVLRYDVRGFGLSEKPTGPVTLDEMTADLAALLDAEGLAEPVTLVGAAVGGTIAIGFAGRWPDRVRGLVGLAPATGIPPERRPGLLALADRLEREGLRDFVLTDMLPNAWPEVLRTDAARLARFVGQQMANSPARFAATYRMLAETDFADTYPRIACPALMVCGVHDKARPPEVVGAVARSLPNGRLEVVESGHFMATQTPDLVIALLRRFLAGP